MKQVRHIHTLIQGLLLLACYNWAALTPQLALVEWSGLNLTPEQIHKVRQATQFTLEKSGYFRVKTQEEIHEDLQKEGEEQLPSCFTDRCRRKLASTLHADILASIYLQQKNHRCRMRITLYNGQTGGEIESEQMVASVFDQASLVSLAIQTTSELLGLQYEPDLQLSAERDSSGNLHKSPTRWLTGAVALLAGYAIAGWQHGGLFLNQDHNSLDSGFTSISSSGALSGLPGFFSHQAPQARLRALGGSGVALSGENGPGQQNPAGLSGLNFQELTLSTSPLPGNSGNQFQLQWAGPFRQGAWWAQGIRFEGDQLASEISFITSLAWDMTLLSSWMTGLFMGANLKGYSLQVGQDGEGMARSTGNALGYGMDIGLQWQVWDRARIGLFAENLLSNVYYHNTLRNKKYQEGIPPTLTLGTVWQSPSQALLTVDLKKAVLVDQKDRLMAGCEYPVWKYLTLRAGVSRILGTSVLMWSLGGSINAEYKEMALRIQYAWENGVAPYDILGSQQIISVGIQF